MNPKTLAVQMCQILYNDLDRLERIDDYLHGRHDDPYMPDRADDEYKLLAKRAVSNWMTLLVNTPAQGMYVDNYRPSELVDEKDSKGNPRVTSSTSNPAMEHWQRSRLDARQHAVHRGALGYGHSFTVTEKKPGKKSTTRGLSAMRTVALFEDPASDITPYAALSVTHWPNQSQWRNPDGTSARDAQVVDTAPVGKAEMWDGKTYYKVTFKALNDARSITVQVVRKHGNSQCPVTRFAAQVDLEGRTIGVVEPMIPLQNRINQSVFDLLVAQTYGSFQVRTVTGMAPPVQRDPETGEPVLDTDGNPIPLPINVNAKRFLFAEDHEAKWGSLPGTPLGGYIESIDMSIRHLSAVSQTPPHYLLGQIANLSADALQAAETSLRRKTDEFKSIFGESWERVFRLASELDENGAVDDFDGEVIWRDLDNKSLAQSADALGKLSQQLSIPARGLWARVPGATQSEVQQWEELADQAPEQAMADALTRATGPSKSGLPSSALPPAKGQFKPGEIPPVGKVADAVKAPA